MNQLSLRRWLLPAAVLLVVVAGAFAWWLEREPCRLNLGGHTGTVRAVAFSADGKLLATGGNDQTVRVRNLPSGSTRATFDVKGGFVFSVALSADSTLLATGSADGTVRVFDLEGTTERFRKPGHKNGVYALLFTPDGKTLVSA